MFEEYQICPYTGLRSFTEEESLYFKGREEHIEQATEQLQRNKFLMLTGASGDGKSSLVYAGIVPNARAGFLKSHYTQWCVADFRPERAPFKNLCKAIARQLAITNPLTVESELQHGFSALVDLYRNSSRFVDYESVTWKNADDPQRAALKRGAANLIIIVDQFEEFFTNPENYHRGVPSPESNLVLNLLLETSRIALEENLPIYVVFTMRSDYIGQCAAFRSLPEYIGFSQFFVPRLNRSQLQQVIEEPASLSGNRITRRLTERLIHDIAEGVDQLPILQHALNQIWHAAANGREEMDLIHYAMVGGVSAGELPDEQAVIFKAWFAQLPEKVKACYLEPNLQNVLDTHANKLYESAAEQYTAKTGKYFSEEKARAIIKAAFTCLTKIDQSRAVRNRMTFKEIYNILNRKDIDEKSVAIIINIFREPGNTFIRPFISDDPESEILQEETVLDITHESLIRNWEYLERWAKEEFNDYVVFLDFDQSLNRWVSSNKSGDFLLSIGPLTYFEGWYNRVKPSASWIARYLPDDIADDKKINNANTILINSQEFLRKSSRKHFITRAVMKYGPRKIAAVLAVAALLVFGSFATLDYFEHQNSSVLKKIDRRVAEIASNPNVQIRTRSWLICEELKLKINSISGIVSQIADPVERINVSTGVATALVYYGRNEPEKEITTGLSVSDSLLSQFIPSNDYGSKTSGVLKEVCDLGKTLELAYYYRPSKTMGSFLKKNAGRAAAWTRAILGKKPPAFNDIADLNVAMEQAINHWAFSSAEIKELIQLLSPLEGTQDSWVQAKYHKDKVCRKGFFSYGFKFNGLYQELAYLYAASGNAPKALQSLDTLLKYNQNYFLNDYATLPDNAYHIAACFFKYGNESALDEFVKGYCSRKRIKEHEFYARLLGRCKVYEFASTNLDLDPRYGFNLNLGLEFSDDKQLQFFFTKYRNAIQYLGEGDEMNFLTALSFKDEGLIHLRKLEVQGAADSSLRRYRIRFDQALELYGKVNPKFLTEIINVTDITNNDGIDIERKFLFLFPDIRTPFHPNEPSLFHFFYTSGQFLKYIIDKNLVGVFYPTATEQQYLAKYFRDYGQVEAFKGYQVSKAIDYTTLVNLEKELSKVGIPPSVNLNMLYLYLAKEAAAKGYHQQVLQYARKLKAEKIRPLFLNSFDRDPTFRLVGETVTGLLAGNHLPAADSLIKMFIGHVNRSSLYSYAALELMRKGVAPGDVNFLIDSAEAEASKIKIRNAGQPNRFPLSSALAMQNSKQKTVEAYKVIKNEGGKFFAIQRICRAMGYRSHLFEAMNNIPENIFDGDYAFFLWHILNGYNEEHRSFETPEWREYDLNGEPAFTHFIGYSDDKN